jgi:feruloyl esterase
MLGTELGWATRIGGPAPNPLGADFVKYAVFKNPDWDWRTFDLETAVVEADRIDVIDASAELRAFMRRGGKLLLYHGWCDQNISAQSTIDYYRRSVIACLVGLVTGSTWDHRAYSLCFRGAEDVYHG